MEIRKWQCGSHKNGHFFIIYHEFIIVSLFKRCFSVFLKQTLISLMSNNFVLLWFSELEFFLFFYVIISTHSIQTNVNALNNSNVVGANILDHFHWLTFTSMTFLGTITKKQRTFQMKQITKAVYLCNYISFCIQLLNYETLYVCFHMKFGCSFCQSILCIETQPSVLNWKTHLLLTLLLSQGQIRLIYNNYPINETNEFQYTQMRFLRNISISIIFFSKCQTHRIDI